MFPSGESASGESAVGAMESGSAIATRETRETGAGRVSAHAASPSESTVTAASAGKAYRGVVCFALTAFADVCDPVAGIAPGVVSAVANSCAVAKRSAGSFSSA